MNSTNTRILAYAIATLLLFIVATVADLRWLWGFNFGRFYPTELFYSAICLIALTCIPQVGSLINNGLQNMSRLIIANRKLMLMAAGSFLMLFLIVSWKHRVATHFLGDATLRLNLLRSGDFWLITEPGDFLIHALINKFIAQPFSLPVEFAYQLTAAASGIVFFVGCWRLIRYMRFREPFLLFLLLISSGLSAQFFAYVESYAILASLLPYIIVSGLKVIYRVSSGYVLLSLYLLAGFIHPLAFLILSGFLVIVLLPRFSRLEGKEVVYNKLLLWFVPVLLTFAYALRYFEINLFERNILPITSDISGRQALLTVTHWGNIFNWLLLSALPLGVLIAAIQSKQHLQWMTSHRKSAGVWLIIPSVLFLLFFTPQLGGGRDWDIFSLPSFLILIGVLIFVGRQQSDESTKATPIAVIPILLIALFNTVAFVGINASVQMSTDRCTELVEMATFRNRTREYMMLYRFAKEHDELKGRRIGFAEMVWSQPPYTKTDSLYIIGELAALSIDKGDKKAAREYIDIAMLCDSTDLNTHLSELTYYSKYGNSSDVHAVAERMARLLHDNALGLMNAGLVYLQRGDVSQGGILLERAYRLGSENTLIVMNYATYLLQIRENRKAAELFAVVTQEEPDNFLGWYYCALSNYAAGDSPRANECLQSAKQQMVTGRQKQMVVELEQEMMK